MDYATHIDAVAREAAAFTEALGAGPVDVVVPSCPDWTVAELAHHAGSFSAFWSHVLCEGSGRPKTPFVEPDATTDLGRWFDELAGYLVGELRATPEDTAVWTWVPGQTTARFPARRAANELAMHRFDLQLARATPKPIDSALAVDGIEEIFMMIDGWRSQPGGADAGSGTGETLHVHAADVDGGEWMVTLTPDGPDVERRHGKADLALRGAASDLELLLYQRPTLGAVERFGDESALAAWNRAFQFG